MRAISLAATAVALGLVIIVTGAAVASTSANSIQLRAAMTAAEEVPAPRGDVTNARGVFTATATKTATGAALSWTLTFGGLSGPASAAHIHTAPRGQSGPVSAPLCGPCESGARARCHIGRVACGRGG